MTAFHDITPELFAQTPDHLFERTTPTEEGPRAWLERMTDALFFATAACDGAINSTAVLGNPHIERVYACTDDETVGDYLKRITVKAGALNASRLFFARTMKVVATKRDGTKGVQSGVVWFADHEGGQAQGIVRSEDGKFVSAELSATLEAADEVANILKAVLGK